MELDNDEAVESVSIKPGATAFDRIPIRANSFDQVLVIASTPDFAALYAV
jgi:hypothetical protein